MLSYSTPKNYWEQEIQNFERQDRLNPVSEGKTLFVGSSSIRLWDSISTSFPELDFINRGFGGSQVYDLILNYDRIITNYKPSRIIIYSGDNDISYGKSAQQISKDFEYLVWLIHEKIDVPIIIISLKPSPQRFHLDWKYKKTITKIQSAFQYNSKVTFLNLYKRFLDKNGKPNLELYQKDRLHLSPKGYEIWVKELKKLNI